MKTHDITDKLAAGLIADISVMVDKLQHIDTAQLCRARIADNDGKPIEPREALAYIIEQLIDLTDDMDAAREAA